MHLQTNLIFGVFGLFLLSCQSDGVRNLSETPITDDTKKTNTIHPSENKVDNIQTPTLEDVTMRAKADLPSFLEKIPMGYEHEYGFLGREQFANATVKKPIRMFTIDKSNLNKIATAQQLPLRPLNQWRVPIGIGDEAKALLTVAVHQNKLQTVALGAAGLALELQQKKRHLTSDAISLLRVHSLQADFAFVDNKSTERRFSPMNSSTSLIEPQFLSSSDGTMSILELKTVLANAASKRGL